MVTRTVQAVTGTLAIAGLLYVYGDAAAAQDAARLLRTLHTTGTVDVDGADVWVTE